MKSRICLNHRTSGMLILILLWILGCSRKNKELAVATVGGDPIPVSSITEAFQGEERFFKSAEEELTEKQKLLDLLVEERLLIQEAYRQKIDRDSAIQNYETFQKPLFLMDHLYNREVRDKIRLSETELARLYGALKNDRCLKQILFKKEEIARQVYNRLKLGQNFDSLARQFSIDRASGSEGGNMGCYGWPPRLPRYFEEVLKMKAGDLLGPLILPEGWVILYCYELRPAQPPALEEIRPGLRKLIENDREQNRLAEVISKIQKELNYQIVDSTLKLANVKQMELSKVNTPGQSLNYSVHIRTEELSLSESNMPLLTYTGGGFTLGQYLQALQGSLPASRPVLDASAATKNALFQLVSQNVVIQAAKTRGLEKEPDYLRKVRQAVEGRMALEMKNRILTPVWIDSLAVKTYFEAHSDEFVHPPAFHMYEINRPQEAELLPLKKQIKTKTDFIGTASQLTSREQLKPSGGDLGWVEQFQFPELFAAASKIKIGQTAGPVKLSDATFSLIYLDGKRPPSRLKFDEIKSQLFQKLLTQAYDLVFRTWVAEQKQKTKIVMNAEVLKKTIDYPHYARLKELEAKKAGGRS